MNEVFIFTHIPKTAGTTLRYHFQKHMQDQDTFIHFANKGDKQAKALGLKPFTERTTTERMRAQVILGHNVNKHTKALIGSNTPYELVCFRDPIEWEISRYNQYANAKQLKAEPFLSFNDWYNTEKIHSQFDWFLLHYALLDDIPKNDSERFETVIKHLHGFQQVCFVDKLMVHLQNIFYKLDVPSALKSENVTGDNKKVNLFKEEPTNLSLLIELQKAEINFFSKIKNFFDRK